MRRTSRPPQEGKNNAKKHQDRGDCRGRSADAHRLQRRRWRRRRRRPRGTRRHHDLVLQQRGRDRVGQADGRGVERRPPRRAGQGAGDPRRRQQRSRHRRRDHRRQRAVPDLQHLARGRAAVREGGRARVAVELRGRRRLHQRAQRRQRGAVRVGGRRVLPDAVEVQPGRHLLQQGDVHRGGPRPRGAGAVDLRRVPRHVAHADRVGRRAVRDLPRTLERVLPVLVRLLPALRGGDRWHAARRGRQGDLRLRSRRGRLRVLGDDVRGGPRRAGGVQRRLLRRRQLGHDDRRALGDRLLRRGRRLGHRAGARHRPARPRRRPTPSATRRTSACSPPARARAPHGTS